MCSVVTNPVMSAEFNPIHRAATLSHFGRTQDGYVAIHFIHLSGTAESTATSDYEVVTEPLGQNEELAGSNKERAKREPSLVLKGDLFDAIVFPCM